MCRFLPNAVTYTSINGQCLFVYLCRPILTVTFLRLVMEDFWFQGKRRGDQSLPTELKMGTIVVILPINYISELRDFITAPISIPETKSTVQHLDFSRTKSESSINVTYVLLFRRMNMTLITFSMKPNFFEILWIEI